MLNNKLVFRTLHIVVVIVSAGITYALAIAEGHPPGIVLVPIAIVIWLIAHFFISFSHRLADRGARSVAAETKTGWPLTLVLLAILFGGISFISLIQMIITSLDQYNRQRELLILLALWVPSTLCFVGMILRQGWSRILASGVFFGLAGLMVAQMLTSLAQNAVHPLSEWAFAVAVVLLSVAVAQHTYRSAKVKAFYSG